jgi:hypothetical protein
MRILRVRHGFQADHSSSSYLFYAVDHEVSKTGQAIANQYSSRAEVDEQYARYLKWGESSLAHGAFEALLDAHYDVMAEESYGWWTLMIAVPKTAEMKAILTPFTDARGDNDQGVEIQEYRRRMVVSIYCQFTDDGVNLCDHDEDSLECLVDLLAKIRTELLQGNTSFLTAVADFYGAFDEDEEEEDEEEPGDDREESSAASFADMSKAKLQQECERRGIPFRKSWTKTQLQEALAASSKPQAGGKATGGKPQGRKTKLSRAARTIVDELDLL